MFFEDANYLLYQGGHQWSADIALKNAGFQYRCCIIARRRQGICAFWLELCSLVSIELYFSKSGISCGFGKWMGCTV